MFWHLYSCMIACACVHAWNKWLQSQVIGSGRLERWCFLLALWHVCLDRGEDECHECMNEQDGMQDF